MHGHLLAGVGALILTATGSLAGGLAAPIPGLATPLVRGLDAMPYCPVVQPVIDSMTARGFTDNRG